MLHKDQLPIFKRRTFILGGIQAALSVGLLGRLYYLQIMQGRHYQLLSDKNRIHAHYLLPERGKILDTSGYVLADSQTSYTCLIIPDHIENYDDLFAKLTKILNLNPAFQEHFRSQYKRRRHYLSLILKEKLSWEELANLELYKSDLPGVVIEKGQSRFYPYPESTCHFLGYVGAISEKKIDPNAFNVDIPGLRVGKSGLEKTFEQNLRGKPGVKQVEVTATHQTVRTLDTLDSVRGEDLQLNIDFRLQKNIHDTFLKHEHLSGSAVVMNVHTGAILGYYSHPGFDTNLFINPISKETWKNIEQNSYKPLINKVISGQYAPGSTMKMIVSLAALNAGIIDPHTTHHCPGHFDYHGHRFHCWNWKIGGHGNMTVQSAISQSCDVFFYNIAAQMGADAITEVAKNFGFGQVTGIDISGEKSGLLPSRTWKSNVRKKPWTGGDTINLSIGQGFALSTPIQLVKMVAMFVNGMRPVTPHLVKRDTTTHTQQTDPLPYHPAHRDLIIKAMIDTVHGAGTARASAPEHGCTMGGKTGSSQVTRITMDQRMRGEVNERGYLMREHALFTGFAPIDDPKYAVCVLIEHGGGGAKAAAPVARDILTAAQQLAV